MVSLNSSSELVSRVKYGVLMFCLAVFLVSIGGAFFITGIVFIACFCAAELFLIIGKNGYNEYTINKAIYKGVCFVAIPALSLYIIREIFVGGIVTSFWFFILIAMVDTFAYFTGKLIGKRKLAPSISPSKTVEGLAGGVIFATIFSIIFFYLFNSKLPLSVYLVFSFIIAILAQVSDLIESYFKRKFDVKNSSNLIPGHGGFLDRLDGYALTAPTLVCFYFLSKTILGVSIF
jgi:phosphatidate cytidylyltransferase